MMLQIHYNLESISEYFYVASKYQLNQSVEIPTYKNTYDTKFKNQSTQVLQRLEAWHVYIFANIEFCWQTTTGSHKALTLMTHNAKFQCLAQAALQVARLIILILQQYLGKFPEQLLKVIQKQILVVWNRLIFCLRNQ
ncbi:hypothetical protein SS50377_21673 [Spironucleus salmonicida]|uniref:Uncharacterized protein n=1 Tax=Spironucleus salmonicida TaxID=348837 RepID=A0A9P8S0P9_9EUKA|nr:hypothetical protein SS50377_21673 [Spironucleus salmonicida]